MDSAIEVSQLSVSHEGVRALWEVNFSVPRGVIAGIIGPNGAGKTTLIKTLLGLQKKVGGTISLLDDVAYVPQRNAVDWDFPITVLDVVLMGRYSKLGWIKWASKNDKEAALRALERVGMENFAHRQIGALSGGQRQRVFLARALVQEADLYLMDEPFAGVDMATQGALLEILQSLKDEGKTFVIVHHDLNTVAEIFDWVLLLNTCLIDSGPVDETFTPQNIQKAYGSSAYLFNEAKRLSSRRG